MLTILIGIVVAGVVFFILWKGFDYFESGTCAMICVLGTLTVVFSIAFGLFVPLEGYEDKAKLIKETELVSLSNTVASEGHGGLFYVSVSANNVYTYRYEVDDEYNISGTSYKVGLLDENVTEVESKDCKIPVLKVYERKAKKGLFTLSLFQNRTEYVFYVPEGSVVKEIFLN